MRAQQLAAGIGLVSAATLVYELAQIRIFAYSLHPVVAFSAIALAMLGFGLGATGLALWPRWSAGELGPRLGGLCAALAASMILVTVMFARTSTSIIETDGLTVRPLWAVVALLPSIVPYFLGGLVTALILGARIERIGRIYFWNLVGSAAGCVAMIVLLRPAGAGRLVLISAALALGAGVVLAWGRSRAALLGAVALAVVVAGLVPITERVFPFAPDATGYNAMFERWEKAQGYAPPARELDEWDPVGRLEVLRHERETIKVAEEVGYRVLTVDGGAMTLLLEGRRERGWGKALFADSIYGAGYHLKQHPDVLVIGAGGGSDIEAALYWQARSVTGIEISLSTLRAVTGPYAEFAGWPRRPEVRMVHADGRAFAKGTDQRFDLVQLSGVDTVTSHASGSMVTVEDYLYTVEAFRDFLGILAPGGVLSVVRFGDEAMNLSMIAVKALRELGVAQPERCVAALRQAKLGGILVKREPFSIEELGALLKYERRKRAADVEIPHYDIGGIRLGDPVQLLHPAGSRAAPRYQAFFGAVARGNEDAAARRLGSSFAVPTDDRPYYMLGRWLKSIGQVTATHPTLRLLAAATLVIAAASLVLVLLPAVALRRRGRARVAELASVSVYFGGLGAGFMLLEVGLIHRAMVFVGTPGASVAVVLAAILVSSGLGSRASDAVGWPSRRRLAVPLVGLLVVGAAYHVGVGALFDALFGLPVWARCCAAALAIAPAGFCMGWFFPVGLGLVGARAPALVPWAIAVNGFASVIGSLATFYLGVALGFSGVFLVALGGYLIAVLALWPLTRAGGGGAAT